MFCCSGVEDIILNIERNVSKIIKGQQVRSLLWLQLRLVKDQIGVHHKSLDCCGKNRWELIK